MQRPAAGRGGCEGDRDEGGFALLRGEGEDSLSEGGAQGPGCGGVECGEGVFGGDFLGG